MSTISSSTTSSTAYKVAADTTGTLVFQTGATPTTAVTIDGSQNVGVGVTPSAWSGVTAFQNKSASIAVTSNGNNMDLATNRYYNGTSDLFYQTGNYALMYEQASGSGAHRWFTSTATGTAGNAISFTQAMTLDVNARLTLNSSALNSSSGYFYQTSPAFNTGNASKYSYYSDSGTKNFGIGFLSDGGGSQAAWMSANSTNLGWVVQTDGANGVRLANTATSWSSYSDERLKNIIEEIPQALSKIAAIRAVRFSWKSDESNAPKVGVIAQDVQAVLPEVVDDDTDFLQVRYSELVPLCIKAIQEQQALIQSLTDRLTALEGAAK